MGEAESLQARRQLFVQAISSDDEDTAENFIVVPSQRASAGVEEEDVEARNEPREADGFLAEATAVGGGSSGPGVVGGGGSSGPGTASPQVGVKRGCWAAADE
jgi:hypothetical protein